MSESEPPPCDCRYACDCREALFSKAMSTQAKIVSILAYSDDSMRRDFGDMSDETVGAVRKVLSRICGSKKL